ncbi:DUF2807 domain-containing protein [Sphingobium sufflavum]|uniref:GIN domain-containing protein n=1 Tax=Sphingobium sufflavum TaxID=1129547 RepID=UPI001F15C395|nr:DUF2807 domain-containing protein [Sphingobium sufflavum]MCE7797671.1 DUF2807 domain-containing protein [Sphingobium sufflavum]
MTIGRRDARPPLPATADRSASGTGRATRIAAAFSWAMLVATGPAFLPQPALAAPAVARQTYTLTDFDTVRVDAPIEVVVTSGKGASALGTGDRAILDALTLDTSSGILTIRQRSGVILGGSGGKARAPTRLTLTTGDLRRAMLNGAGSLTVDRLKGGRTEATVRGSGTLTIARVETDRLDIALIGAGSMILTGKAIEIVAAVGGSGRLDATGLDAQRIRIDTEGSIDARLTASGTTTATSNGTGRVTIAGKGQCVVRKTGNASIRCGGADY